MFDLTSSKLLILGIVALLVVGPKELPALLRTIGKYVGIMRRHAAEFRVQFDDAMRDQELASLKADMDAVKRDIQATVGDVKSTVVSAGRGLEADMTAATIEIDATMQPGVPRWGEKPAEAAAEPAHASAAPPEPEHRIHGATPPVAAEPAPKVGA